MRLNHVTIAVTDIEESKAFYARLGLQLIVDSPHYARFLCPDGDSTFSIEFAETVEAGSMTVYFECDELDSLVAGLKDKGCVFEHDVINQRWLWREARLRDPDGHRICLFLAGRNRINPPWRVGGNSVE